VPEPTEGKGSGISIAPGKAGAPFEERRGKGRVRIAAVGDFHCGEEDAGAYRDLFTAANAQADVLLLCGDLTRRGLMREFNVVCGELSEVRIPIVAVLGNHDHESGEASEAIALLRSRGVHLLNGTTYQLNEHVGVAGAAGFMGGFGRGTLTSFGEPETKAFVGKALREAQKLELALRALSTPVRVVMLHYAPVQSTVAGEPEIIHMYLGTDRLAEPIDRYGATVAFHGHAHTGTFRGATAGGVPVFNVSLPLLRRENPAAMFYVHEIILDGSDD
jgi:Icc-related predicted phosphoesterase